MANTPERLDIATRDLLRAAFMECQQTMQDIVQVLADDPRSKATEIISMRRRLKRADIKLEAALNGYE